MSPEERPARRGPVPKPREREIHTFVPIDGKWIDARHVIAITETSAGRIYIHLSTGPSVIVDYTATPENLERVASIIDSARRERPAL